MEVSRSWLWVPDQYTTTTATATKTSLKNWIHVASNFIAFIPSRLIRQMLANFLELNSKWLYQSSGKEKESCCLRFPSLKKPEIRHFHVVVVQWRQRNVQKSVMHVQSCCFANLNLLLFCRSRCRCRRRCLSSLLKIWTPGGVLLGILGGGSWCLPVLQILTRFQTKKCHFPHPFSDQTSKIHTRLQTWPLGRNYVIIT